MLDLRRPYGVGGIARDETIHHGLFERLAQHAVHLAHCGAGKSGVQLLAVETSHVGGAEILEL